MNKKLILMNKIDLNFRITFSSRVGLFEGETVWESSNAKIIEKHGGNERGGYAGIYLLFHKNKLIREIPFSYSKSLKHELAKIDLDALE